MHVHAIIRFDTDGGTALHPAVARAAIQRAAAAVSTPAGHRFGPQVDVRTISGSDAGAALDRRRAAGYLAKYATGSAVDVHAKHAGPTAHLRRLQEIAARRLLPAEVRKVRRHCPTVGLSDQEQTLAEDRARRRARELGFTGHYLTKSRRFSTTFTVLRDARRTHAESFAPAPHATSSATTTDVVWTYLGRGYRFEHRSIAVAVRWLRSSTPPVVAVAA